MQLSVKDLLGNALALEVQPFETVAGIKAQIQEKVGIPLDQQHLSLQLEDDRSLSDYQIHGDSSLHVHFSIRVRSSSMKIFVQTPEGFLPCSVKSTDTVESVMVQIEGATGVPAEEQRLFLGERRLAGSQTLEDCKVQTGATLHLGMQVHVMTPVGDTFPVDVHASATVADLKEKIHEKVGTAVERQHLHFGGKELDGAHTLAECKIHRGSTVQLVMQIRVETTTGDAFSLIVQASDSVESIKERIRERDGTPPERQRLTYHGKYLEEGGTLSSCGITDGSTLRLGFRIFVKLPSGRTLPLTVLAAESVDSVKEKIWDRESIPPARLSLSYGGRKLEGYMRLSACKVQEGSTLRSDILLPTADLRGASPMGPRSRAMSPGRAMSPLGTPSPLASGLATPSPMSPVARGMSPMGARGMSPAIRDQSPCESVGPGGFC